MEARSNRTVRWRYERERGGGGERSHAEKVVGTRERRHECGEGAWRGGSTGEALCTSTPGGASCTPVIGTRPSCALRLRLRGARQRALSNVSVGTQSCVFELYCVI